MNFERGRSPLSLTYSPFLVGGDKSNGISSGWCEDIKGRNCISTSPPWSPSPNEVSQERGRYYERRLAPVGAGRRSLSYFLVDSTWSLRGYFNSQTNMI